MGKAEDFGKRWTEAQKALLRGIVGKQIRVQMDTHLYLNGVAALVETDFGPKIVVRLPNGTEVDPPKGTFEINLTPIEVQKVKEEREATPESIKDWPEALQAKLEEDVLDLVEQNQKMWGKHEGSRQGGIPFTILVTNLRNRAFHRDHKLKSNRHWVMGQWRIRELEDWLPKRGFTLANSKYGLEVSI